MIKNKKVELAVVKKLPVDLRGKISAKNSKKKGIIRFFRKVLKFELNNSFKIFTVKNKKIEEIKIKPKSPNSAAICK